MGKNTVQAKQWIEKCYPDSCPSKETICRWFAEFERGRTDTNDAERSGRPVEAVTPENKLLLGCKCRTECRSNRCSCKKNNANCADLCACDKIVCLNKADEVLIA
ncbi:HTH_48 domain-containing protein [Nephila pilipes]|uniref:HTH_48 domain-containing protein n=1 Tax=Nephila pilipes TaxID=299642 RepID=A0A8X6KBX5_NEPPI|nr:HTH_48 domain-containing protein [Nephila pilipes]